MTITEVDGPARLVEIEELQIRVWNMDERGVVPVALLGIIASSGGILLAAHDAGRPVGFVLGLLARRAGRLYHASHMLGTDPAYQGRGIGVALKLRQRDYALAQGLDLMTWTFDPLIARNAHFNLHKLGTVSRTYYEDYYGPMEDRYNSGLPSDRLLVEWSLRDSWPPDRERIAGAPVTILLNDADTPVLRLDDVPSGAPLRVQIPLDIVRIKETDVGAALVWRLAMRQAFSWALSHGYMIRDFANGAYLLLPREEG